MDRIGKYEITGELGRGGFGRVYKAFDPTVGRVVAIKVLNLDNEPDTVARFEAEAKTSANLQHKNIVTVYEFGEQNRQRFLVMEYLSGKTLQEIIHEKTPIAPLEKLIMMSEVAQGLQFAHEHGVVHRDVKPANIMRLSDGSIKIMDFGIARLLNSGDTPRTQSGMIIGTIQYMAPERFNSNIDDEKCDIWAFGNVLYEFLSGINPFRDDNLAGMVYRIASEDPATLSSFVAGVPESLDAIVKRLLAKSRDERYSSLEDFRFDLEPVLMKLRRAQVQDDLKQAEALIAEERLEEALSVTKRILVTDQTNLEARKWRRELPERIRVQSSQMRIKALVEQADADVSQRDYRTALERLEAAAHLDPSNQELKGRISAVQAEQERAKRAASLLMTARVDYQQDSLTAALELAKESIQLDPENPEVRTLLDTITRELDRRDAEAQRKDALNRAKGLVILQTYEEALSVLSELELRYPEDSEIKNMLKEARRLQAASASQQKLDATIRESRDLIRRSQYQRAIDALEAFPEEILQRDQVDALLSYARAQLEQQKRAAEVEDLIRRASEVPAADFATGIRLFDQALERSPGNEKALRLRRDLLAARQADQENQAIQSSVQECRALIDAGRLDEATARSLELKARSPEHPSVAEIDDLVGRAVRERRECERKQGQREAPEQPPAESDVLKSAEPEAGLTVRVSRQMSDLPPPPADGGGGGPPLNFTTYFAKGESGEPRLEAFLTIVSCPDSFLVMKTLPIIPVPFAIGRETGNLLIPEDKTVSREHAIISWSGSGFNIRDLGTPNGTYVNGRLLRSGQDEPLPLNAEIRLSTTTRLRFRCEISELPDFRGQKLASNRYTLEKCLRAGRKSALYEARDSRPVRKVAVKLLSPTLASYPGYREQFEREAQAAAELTHPNICRIYEHGCAPLTFSPGKPMDTHFVSMQLLDGGSLAERMDAPEHSTAAAVASWLDVVADALNDAHRNGVMHAGLKPTSIVFSAAGFPYVTDFAIATRAHDGERSQPILGAPDYLAPEQWDGLPAAPATDQYSLAALCYRVLTGAVPFENQLDPQARKKNFEMGAVPPDSQARKQGRPALPSMVSTVLARALSVPPGDRFPSIRDFAIAFRKSLAQETPLPHKPRVFVSYRRGADAGWAAFFADKLTAQHGLDVFVDRQRVDSARQVPEKIESAIRQCDFFVCLLAKSTLESAWVREEIRIADAAGKRMIPVVQEGFRRPKARPIPDWLKWFVPRAWLFPECARRLMDAEEVRLFADYDESAIEKLAKMILHTQPKS